MRERSLMTTNAVYRVSNARLQPRQPNGGSARQTGAAMCFVSFNPLFCGVPVSSTCFATHSGIPIARNFPAAVRELLEHREHRSTNLLRLATVSEPLALRTRSTRRQRQQLKAPSYSSNPPGARYVRPLRTNRKSAQYARSEGAKRLRAFVSTTSKNDSARS
jgi:hypothetical protein